MNLKKNFYLAVVAILFISFSACEKDDISSTVPYAKTIIPADINDQFKALGNASSDTVVVYAQGGPEFDFLTEDIEVSHFNNYYRAYVYQSQHINESMKVNELTFAEATEEDQISTEMYYNVVKHFKDQGKFVIAASHSFGSFITPNVLVKYPNIADRWLIMAGRFDMPEQIWHGFRDGTPGAYESDGTTITMDGGKALTGSELTNTRLAAGLGQNRYTQLLAGKDLSNVLYVYAQDDEAVGALTQQEIDAMLAMNIPIQPLQGGHSSMFAPNVLDVLLDWLRK